ncbi:MAG: hypothetical protein U1D31_00530, partial [Patescibacteria group bacterium]|nr:hypothetical protein [Patescibacteria group bacterium]
METKKTQNTHTEDHFWKWFLFFSALLSVGSISFLYFSFFGKIIAGSLPNSHSFLDSNSLSSTTAPLGFPVVYDESLHLGWENWSTNTRVNDKTRYASPWGNNSLLVNFDFPYAEFYIHAGPLLPIAAYTSVEFDISADLQNEGELVMELLQNETGLGEQSVEWYAPQPLTASNGWQHIVIPLENLNATTTISGIRVQLNQIGRIYIDNLKFSEKVAPHSRWIAPVYVEDLYPQETWIQYPLSQVSRFDIASDWLTRYGGHTIAENNLLKGFALDNSQISLSVFTGGLTWSDYAFNVISDWGNYEAVSLVVRYQDADNYLQCTFSEYASYVEISETKRGKQKLLAHAYLTIALDEAWKDI